VQKDKGYPSLKRHIVFPWYPNEWKSLMTYWWCLWLEELPFEAEASGGVSVVEAGKS
jgi:hypothetical protein